MRRWRIKNFADVSYPFWIFLKCRITYFEFFLYWIKSNFYFEPLKFLLIIFLLLIIENKEVKCCWPPITRNLDSLFPFWFITLYFIDLNISHKIITPAGSPLYKESIKSLTLTWSQTNGFCNSERDNIAIFNISYQIYQWKFSRTKNNVILPQKIISF